MSNDVDLDGLRIPSYMNLEQAMEEVRKYLEAKELGLPTGKGAAANPVDRSRQFFLQNTLISQLSEISNRFGQVEPNSKFGPPGVFMKKLVRKAIGWYSRPTQEFDRTVIEALQQIRRDMLALQLQIATLDRKLGAGQSPVPATHPQLGEKSKS